MRAQRPQRCSGEGRPLAGSQSRGCHRGPAPRSGPVPAACRGLDSRPAAPLLWPAPRLTQALQSALLQNPSPAASAAGSWDPVPGTKGRSRGLGALLPDGGQHFLWGLGLEAPCPSLPTSVRRGGWGRASAPAPTPRVPSHPGPNPVALTPRWHICQTQQPAWVSTPPHTPGRTEGTFLLSDTLPPISHAWPPRVCLLSTWPHTCEGPRECPAGTAGICRVNDRKTKPQAVCTQEAKGCDQSRRRRAPAFRCAL